MPLTPQLSRVESCLTPLAPLTPLTPRLSPLAGAALGDSWLSGGLLDAIHAVDATAVLRGRRGTWWLSGGLGWLMPLTWLTPGCPAWQARHLVSDSLHGGLLDAVDTLGAAAVFRGRRGNWWLFGGLLDAVDAATVSRGRRGTWWLSGVDAVDAALGDSLEGCLARLMPLTSLTPPLSCVARALLLTTWWRAAIDAVDATAVSRGLMPRLVAVLLGRGQTWWRSGGLLDAVDAVDTADARHLVTLCMEGCLTPWTPLTPRLFAWQAPHFNSLEGCLMPLTPLTPRLSHIITAPAFAWLSGELQPWRSWRRCDAVDAVDAATVSHGRRGTWWLSGGLLDTVATAVSRGRRGTWWLSGGLLDVVGAVDAAAVSRGRLGTWWLPRRTAWRRGTWWLCGELLDAICTKLNCVWTSLNRVNSVWTSFNRVWTSLNRVWTSHEPFWTVSEPVWTSMNHVSTSLNRVWTVSEPVWTVSEPCLNQSKPCLKRV